MRMRKLMLPPFHGEAIAGYAELIREVTNAEIDRWRPGADDPHAHGRPGDHDGGDHPGGLRRHGPRRIAEFKHYLPRLSSINPIVLFMRKDLGPRSPWGRFLRNRDRVDEMLYEEIAQRRGESGDETARRHPHACCWRRATRTATRSPTRSCATS